MGTPCFFGARSVLPMGKSKVSPFIFLFLAGCCEFSGPKYHGRKTDHFDGEKFFNPIPGEPKLGALLQWQRTRHQGAWPDFAGDVKDAAPPPERVGKGELRVTLVNHATVLIQLDGVNLLTDPVWGEVAGPVPFIGRKRHRAPGLRLEDLPPIDAVLLSHDHYDHLDLPTLQRLVRAHHPRILAGLGMGKLLALSGVPRVTELDWWRWTSVNGVRIHGVPARHQCRRGACDGDARLWLGYVVRSARGPIYFAGDTGYGPHFQQIFDRFGAQRLALLPISPGTPREIFAPVHLDAAEAVIASRVLQARESVPIHFGTFAQGDEADGEAEEKLLRALQPTDHFRLLHNGEVLTSSPAAGGS